MANSGIYQIVNTLNGHRYVGSAVDLNKRQIDHWSMLRNKNHHSRYLQNAWNKYGEKAFKFIVLFSNVPTNILRRFEQAAFDILKPEYNIVKNATKSQLGRRHSEETKAKISKTLKMKGAAKGNTFAKGYRHTEEAKRKMSRANMGNQKRKGQSPTKETRTKLSRAGKDRKHPEETKAKISQARTGMKFSEQHKANMSKSQKERRARERNHKES